MGTKNTKGYEFSDQAFLMDFIHLFENTVYNPNHKPGEQPFEPVNYPNFIQLSGEPGAEVDRLISTPYSQELAFNSFTTAQLSLLVPQIKIYVTIRTDQGPVYAQLPLNDAQTLESITKSFSGRGTDVTFESIEWVDQNKNDLEGAYVGSLKMRFQTLEGLFMKRGTLEGVEYGFFNLIHAQQSRDQYVSQQQQNVQDANIAWPIKIAVGYSVPDDPHNSIFTQQQIRLVNSLRQTILISVNKHELDFDEDGSVRFSAYFTGLLDFKASTNVEYDLFLTSPITLEDQIVKSERSRISRQIKELKGKQEGGELVSNRDKEVDKKTLNGLQQRLYSLNSVSEKDAYSQLLNYMNNFKISNVAGDGDEVGGRLLYIDLTKDVVKGYSDLKETFTKQIEQGKGAKALTTAQLKQKQDEKTKKVKNLYDSINDSLFTPDIGQTDQYVNEAVELIKQAGLSGTKSRKKFLQGWGKKYSSNTKKRGEPYRLNFFFLGDLIQAACAIIHERPEIKSDCIINTAGNKANDLEKKMWDQIRVIVGTVRIKNPLSAIQVIGGKEKKNLIDSICLADLPISFNTFQNFWNEKVWQAQKTKYSLPAFLRDLCTDLISRAVDGCLFGGKLDGESDKAKIYRFNIPNGDPLDQIWKKGVNKRITLEEIAESRWESVEQNRGNDVKEYMFIQGNISAPDFLKVKKDNLAAKRLYNEKNSISTLTIGGSSGLVKKITLDRIKTPSSFVAENITRNADATGNSLITAQMYNCNVEMFGNPIIRNGNFIYLEPRSLGVPSELPKSLKGEVPSYEWAAYIGLAGYYLVVKTTHKITRQGYTTSVYGQPDYVQIGYEQPVLGNKKPSQNNMKKDISSK
jgi:hypothetical protein